MDFEKEYIPDEQEDFDTDFDTDTEEITPIKSLRSDPPPQYFTNIDGKYCKDVAGREELDELKAIVDDVPWQPLEDGYSNFWFELSNDTLSPWLNFSAKNAGATIDWGDGSGEVALDTLTPTHTYAKAGKYVVKCKGVTGIAQQLTVPYKSSYLGVLKAVELNSEITAINIYSFRNCVGLKNADLSKTVTTNNLYWVFMFDGYLQSVSFPATIVELNQTLYGCSSIDNVEIPTQVTTLNTTFYNCVSLTKITVPSSVTTIGANTFSGCFSLSEIHIQNTTPPTLGINVFNSLPSDWICYVPVGYGETYKTDTAWSTYADHILEEGQTPNRMMLAKFNSAKTEESEVKDDELYKDENR